MVANTLGILDTRFIGGACTADAWFVTMINSHWLTAISARWSAARKKPAATIAHKCMPLPATGWRSCKNAQSFQEYRQVIEAAARAIQNRLPFIARSRGYRIVIIPRTSSDGGRSVSNYPRAGSGDQSGTPVLGTTKFCWMIRDTMPLSQPQHLSITWRK